MIKRMVLVGLLLLAVVPVLAQNSGGQFWVQAFEDRNGNGQHDAGEPFLTHGVSVDLLNADGVVMASGTLDNAPFASRGFIGFLYLAPGKYTAVITSLDLTPTTPERVDVTITDGTTPVTVMFGAQQVAASETTASTSGSGSIWDSEVARIALSGFGALAVVGVMLVLGLLIYVLGLRRRAPVKRTTTTGSLRPVRLDETGEIRRTGESNKS